jgi:YD repeat-containing protein
LLDADAGGLGQALKERMKKNGVRLIYPHVTYDSGANAKGRLSAITDPAAISSWTYNSQGRVASKAQQVDRSGPGD